MAIYLKSKKFDLEAGKDLFILLHRRNAEDLGVKEGEIVLLGFRDIELYVKVIITDSKVQIGEVGLYEEVTDDYHIPEGSKLLVDIPSISKAIEAIKRKMSGHKLVEEELVEIMKDIGSRRLKETEIAFFVSTFFSPGFTDDEIYFMTKGMAESGEILDFKYIKGNKELVVDKHSIGGTAGKGITPILIPILAVNGFVVPNTSTRAITSPAGTTDILETVMPVALSREEVYKVVEKAGACMVWGGSLYLAPADDEIINVERSLRIQEFQKVLVSIVAKKVATGATFVLIDLPYGKGTKIEKPDDLNFLSREFEKLFSKFAIDCVTHERLVKGPDGNGVGPILEIRECLRVLERDEKRSEELEDTVVEMATKMFEHVGKVKKGQGKKLVQETLDSGKALKKFWEMAKAQGARKEIKSNDLKPGNITYELISARSGLIKNISTREIVNIARALGTPKIKEAGIYLEKMQGEKVKKGDILMTLYATSQDRMDEGIKAINFEELYDF
jgi:AMP phosphorylase